MSYLLDASILVRLANPVDPLFPCADQATARLHMQGEALHITPQVIVEFRSVATRPQAVNGLGLSANLADSAIAVFETRFPMLEESPAIYPQWKAVVRRTGTLGKQVHDARLAAICEVFGISHVLTFNIQHFARFVAAGSAFQVVDPRTV